MEPKDLALTHRDGANMQKKAMPEEDRVNIVDALRGQQEQVKRLTAQKMWISDSTKATLSEIKAQLGELKRLLTRLESDIRDQLKKRTGTQPMRQRSPKASAKARDLADQEIDKISDQSASAEDRQERKRRLLKGPEEFREVGGMISPKRES
jgi:hypothetical protein